MKTEIHTIIALLQEEKSKIEQCINHLQKVVGKKERKLTNASKVIPGAIKENVLKALEVSPHPLSAIEIARNSGIKYVSVSYNLHKLLKEGKIIKSGFKWEVKR